MNAREFVTNLAYRLVSQQTLRQYEQGLDNAKRKSDSMYKSQVLQGKNQTQQLGHYQKLVVQTALTAQRAYAQTQRQHHTWIGQAKKDVLGLDATYKRIFTGLRTLIPLALGAAVTGVTALGTALGTVGSRYEMLKAQMATANTTNKMGGKDFWRAMQFMRDQAPLTTEEQMLSAYSTFKNAGLGTSNKALRAYGNLASGTGMTLDQAANNAANGEQGLNAFGIESTRVDRNGDEWANGEYLRVKFRGMTTTIRNEAEAIQNYLQGLGNGVFKYGLSNLATTTEGRFARLGHTLKFVADRIWEGGLKQQAHKFLEWATKTIVKMAPLAEKWIPRLVNGAIDFAQKALPKVIAGVQKIKQLAPYVLTFIGVMTMRMFGLKALMAADWLVTFAVRAIFWLNTLTLRAIVFNAVAFAIPVAIGAVIAALLWTGYQVWQYLSKGEAGIAGLRKQFPLLADGVVYLGEVWKQIQPHLMKLISKTWDLIVVVGEHLLPIAKWTFMNVIVPGVLGVITVMAQLVDWIRVAAEYWLPRIGQSFVDWWDGAKTIWAWFEEKFPWLINALKTVGDLAGSAFNGAANLLGLGGGGGEAGDTSSLSGLANDKVAERLIANAYRVKAGVGKCFTAVAAFYEETFGDYGNFSGIPAYRAADQLARDKRFREVKLSPAQIRALLSSEEGRKQLMGAIAVYNTRSGFNPTFGHIEAWDTKNMKSLYGRGATSMVRSDQMYQNMRLFLPEGAPSKKPVQVALPSGPQSQRSTTINVTVHKVEQKFPTTPPTPQAFGRQTGTSLGNSLIQTMSRMTP